MCTRRRQPRRPAAVPLLALLLLVLFGSGVHAEAPAGVHAETPAGAHAEAAAGAHAEAVVPAASVSVADPSALPGAQGGADARGEERLSEEEVLRRLLEHSPDLRRIGQRIAEARSEGRGAEGIFDYLLDAEAGFTQARTPVAQGISQGVTRTDVWRMEVGVSRTFAPGTNLRLALENSVVRSAVPIRLEGFNDTIEQGPNLDLGLSLTLRQPLLQGFGAEVTELPLRVAALRLRSEELRLAAEASSRALEALALLAELAQAEEEREVRGRSLERSRRQLAISEAEVEAGRVAPFELDRIRERILASEEAYLLAEALLRQRSRALQRLLGSAPAGASALRARPSEGSTAALPEAAALCTLAEQRSPELAVLERSVDLARLQVAGARDRVRPSLDATATVGTRGLDERVADAFAQFGSFEARTLGAGLVFRMPLGNVTAREELTRTQMAVENATFERDELARQLCWQIVEQREELDALAERERLGAARVAIAERALAADERRFAQGLSTVQAGIELRESLEQAELALLRLRADGRALRLQIEHLSGALFLERIAGIEGGRAESW